MNAYERRQRHRQLLRKARTIHATPEKFWDIFYRIKRFEDAQVNLNGWYRPVKYKNGWYCVGGRAYRKDSIDKMSSLLEAHAHVRDMQQVEAESD